MSILTNQLLISTPVQGNLLRQQNERFEHLPQYIRVSEASEDAGFMKKGFSSEVFFTIHDIQLAGLGCVGSCPEYTSPRDDERSMPRG